MDTRFPEETFRPQDRKYAGISTITKTAAVLGHLAHGGVDEGKDNYFPLCYSDDGGRTWVDPYIVVDHPDADDKGIGVGHAVSLDGARRKDVAFLHAAGYMGDRVRRGRRRSEPYELGYKADLGELSAQQKSPSSSRAKTDGKNGL